MQSQLASAGLIMALVSTAASMNISWTGNCSISSVNSDYANLEAFNTTSVTNFTVPGVSGNDDPWYYYLTLRDETHGATGFINRWLGIPESFLESDAANYTDLCSYTISGQDKRMKNTAGNDTCKGVISDKCADAFLNPESKARQSYSFGNCDRIITTDCDSDGIYSTSSPSRLTKEASCFAKGLPGLNVPKGYLVLPLLDVSFGTAKDKETGEFAAYDKAVKQSVPTFLSFTEMKSAGMGTTIKPLLNEAVCGIPNEVHGNSRPVLSSGKQLELSRMTIAGALMLVLVAFCLL